ncbi:MAG: hypothetical protein JWM88_2736 [Verrucomicrobia bacterium]|nr:hypothetical protein [Verrucomicrobiota bacterium]
MARLKPLFQRQAHLLRVSAYAATIGVFLWICSQFYLPGKGFTYLIAFGDRGSANFIPQLRAVNHYELNDSPGYDGSHYAQIAMQPNLSDPALKRGVDNLSYRARRILFCWTAYALALGDPTRAMHLYAVQNIACWLLLAAVLLRWFPPVSWGNFFRWFAVLFSYGMCFSLRRSLVDGPSLLLIACGVALAEKGHWWRSALVLGISGLGKETNVLGGAALAWPARHTPGEWLKVAARLLVVVLPIAVWLLVLRRWLGPSNDLGINNFTYPVMGYLVKWRDTLADLIAEGSDSFARYSLMMLVALTAQALFFVLRRQWGNLWWRIAAVFTVMMIFLGQAVWEGYPGAASRVLLPMTLAFNILVPRGWRWWPVLLVGNLVILASPDMLRAPGRESYQVSGERALRMVPETGRLLEAVFDDKWYPPERSHLEYWRWSKGPATLTLRNPHPFPLLVTISFGVRSKDARTVGLWQGTYARWERRLAPGEMREVKVRNMRLEPGDTVWRFETDVQGTYPASDDPRRLAFSLRDLTIAILGKADVIPPAR